MSRPAHGGNLAWAAAVAGCPAEAIVDFSASISPLGPPPSVLAAIQTHFSEIAAYPDINYGKLRQALAGVHQIPAEWILPGNGAAELLTWAGWDLADLGQVLLVTPAFSDYRRCLKAFNANVVEWPLSLVGGSLQPILEPGGSLSQGLLLNNPHNPTGQLFRREDILPYLEQLALVVVDEAFMDFLPPSEQQSLIGAVATYPNLVILRSLTKFYSLPGLRLGYAIAHPDRILSWQSRRDPWPVNVLAAAAGVAAVGDVAFQQQTWSWLPQARAELFHGLQAIPGIKPLPGVANFLLVETVDALQLQERLLRSHRILIRDCFSFPELGERYFRVAVRSSRENQRLVRAIADVVS